MSANTHEASIEAQMNTTLKKLLGSLELEVMSFMWRKESATVQEVTDTISRKRRVAYTTIMTVLVHLVGKGLLTRLKKGRNIVIRLP